MSQRLFFGTQELVVLASFAGLCVSGQIRDTWIAACYHMVISYGVCLYKSSLRPLGYPV